jgi:hypothetical protein
MRTNAIGLAALLLLNACDPSEDGSPAPDVSSRPLAGTYHVASSFQVPATAAAPGPLGDALRLVHGLAENPAGTLLDVAADAGAPALDTLQLVVPDALEDQLESWMNAYLTTATSGGVSPHGEIVRLDDLIRSVLLAWELRSELRLEGDADGTHAPLAIAFDVLDAPVVIPVEATDPVTAATGVSATVSWPDVEGAAQASVSDHAMGVPFGRYALQALDLALLAEWGAADVRGMLDDVVDCAGMGRSVAGRCVGLLCVGHAEEVEAACAAGLGEVAARIEARILALDYDAIRFQAGTATVEGVSIVAEESGSVTADRLVGGVWTATVDLGQGAEAATATFTAAR